MDTFVWILFAIWVLTVGFGSYLFETFLDKKRKEENQQLKKENKTLKLAIKNATESMTCCSCKFQESCSKGVLNNTQCYYNLIENARMQIEEEDSDAL